MSIEVRVGMGRHRRAPLLAIVFGWLLVSGAAHAQSEPIENADRPQQGFRHDELSDQEEMEVDENGAVKKRREPLYLGLDATVGFGTYTSVLQANPLPPDFNTSYVFDATQIRSVTFMTTAHYRFKKFGIGLRMPFISGHIYDDVGADGGQLNGSDLFTTGNLELSLDMRRRLSAHVRYIPQIALSLPTASGSTPPYSQAQLTARTSGDINAASAAWQQYDQYALGLAAAYARGGEDDALFFNWRLGVTPKVAFDMKFNHTKVIAYAKVPIMFGLEQNPGAEEPVRIEIVGGVKVAQEIGPVQLGVRVVAMVPIATRVALNSPMVSVWPEIRLQLTPSAQFWLTGMIPLVGLSNNCTQNSGQSCDTVIGGHPSNGNTGAFQAGIGATF